MDVFSLINTWLGLTMANIYLPVNMLVMFCVLKIVAHFSSIRALIVSSLINVFAIIAYSVLVWATDYETFLRFRFEGQLINYITLMSGIQLIVQGILMLSYHSFYQIRIKNLLIVTLMSNFYTYLLLLFLTNNSAIT